MDVDSDAEFVCWYVVEGDSTSTYRGKSMRRCHDAYILLYLCWGVTEWLEGSARRQVRSIHQLEFWDGFVKTQNQLLQQRHKLYGCVLRHRYGRNRCGMLWLLGGLYKVR